MRTSCVLAAVLATIAPSARAGTAAQFWLSTDSVASSGPDVVDLSPTVGDVVTLSIWGRPADGRQFDAVSLNLVANGAQIDLVDGSYTFFNVADGSTDRFEFVVDSGTTPSLESDYTAFELGLGGVTDAVKGLNGFDLTDSSPRGPGPVCGVGETGCVIDTKGVPAWLIASFDVAAIDAGVVDLRLQIGDRGVVERTIPTGDYDLTGYVDTTDHAVWAAAYGDTGPHAADGNLDNTVDAADYTVWRDHVGDSTALLSVMDTEVQFGVDGMGGDEPMHNALTDREVNLMGDDPDATFTISAPAQSVPEPAALIGAVVLLISNATGRPTGRG